MRGTGFEPDREVPQREFRAWRMSDRRQIEAARHTGGADQGLSHGGRALSLHGTGQMVHSSRLHHDIEVAQRAALAISVGVVLTAFVLLAAAATVYDVGKWLTIW
jgi:hypothetical protein